MKIKLYILLLSLLALPTLSHAEESMTVSVKRLTLDTALRVAQGAIAECRKKGFQIAVVVVDRSSHVQAFLRDTVAPDITLRIAPQKAYAALSFRVPTSQLTARANSPVAGLDGIVMAAGGLPIEAGGEFYGAIGVAGAPTDEIDEECAAAGVKSVVEDLELE